MATRTLVVCDRHDDGLTLATHHNTWTNLKGEERHNDLCDDHQAEFLKLWGEIDSGSTKVKGQPAKRRQARERHPKSQLIRAWAQKEGMELSPHGRIPYHIERAWKEAGSPDVTQG